MGKSGLDEDSGLMISVWGTRTKCWRCCVLAEVSCSPWSVLGHSLSSLLSGGSHQGSLGPTTETPWHLQRAKKGEGKGEKNKKRKGTNKKQKKGIQRKKSDGNLQMKHSMLCLAEHCLYFQGVERTAYTNYSHLTVISWLAPSDAPRSVRGVWLCHMWGQ